MRLGIITLNILESPSIILNTVSGILFLALGMYLTYVIIDYSISIISYNRYIRRRDKSIESINNVIKEYKGYRND